MELSSHHQPDQKSFSSIPASLLAAIQIAFAFRISQLRKSPPFFSKPPTAAGLPPLLSFSKTSSGRRFPTLKKPQAPTSSVIGDVKPQDFSSEEVLRKAECGLDFRSVAGNARGENSGVEEISHVGNSNLGSTEGRDSQFWSTRRREQEIEAAPVDEARYPVSGVPFVNDSFEHVEEESYYPQKRSTEIVPEENGVEGAQDRELPSEWPLESEISFESSEQLTHGNSERSLVTGPQPCLSSSLSVGYDSEVEDNAGSAKGHGSSKKLGGKEVLDKESDRFRGRQILYPEIDHVEGASVYRMPEDEIDKDGGVLSLSHWAVAAFQFQVQLIVQTASWIESIFRWWNSYTSDRIGKSLQAKDGETKGVSQRDVISSTPPPNISEVGTVLVKQAAWGCLAATYIFVLLSTLLLPALLLDFAFVSKIVEEPASIKESLHFDYTKPHPAAVVFLRPLQGDGGAVTKPARHHKNFRTIPFSHGVHITVMLTLPESDYNRNIGMFQLTAELLSEHGRVVKSSSRPCLLQYHSAPIRLAKTVLASLPSLIGILTESQKLVVHMMEFEKQHVLTGAVRISLQPKAGMKLGDGVPEIYSAEVHIESTLPWPKELLRSWKWTFYIWMALAIYTMEILMILCCCQQVLMPRTLFGKTEETNHNRRVGRALVTTRETKKHT